jgi:LPXTG-motif cell wall-anchored protein
MLSGERIPLLENLKALIRSGKLIKTSDFGWRINPLTGERQFHNGTDLAPRDGRPIWIYVGRPESVIDASNAQCGNGLITVWNRGRTRIGFCHLSEWKNEGGLWIKLGTTGSSTGVHLHLTVTHDGQMLDPWEFLHKYQTQKQILPMLAGIGLIGLGIFLYLRRR